jgi:hypothetical protein
MAYRVRFHIFRILTVLCEKDEPYFLDYMGPLECSGAIASAVMKEASGECLARDTLFLICSLMLCRRV